MEGNLLENKKKFCSHVVHCWTPLIYIRTVEPISEMHLESKV